MKRKLSKPKVKERKLGRERARGLHWPGKRFIEIDPRLKSRDYLETLIHELLHERFHKLQEIKVLGYARMMADVLWAKGFRRVMK